jgi:hypothetical protein
VTTTWGMPVRDRGGEGAEDRPYHHHPGSTTITAGSSRNRLMLPRHRRGSSP